MRRVALALFICFNFLTAAVAQNSVPFVSAVTPAAVAPGGADFALSVRGANFVSGQSAIYWNETALPDPTTCSASKSSSTPPTLAVCTVTVRAAKIATAGTANITVVNPNTAPALGASNVVFLPVTNATKDATGLAYYSSLQRYINSPVVGDFNGDGILDLAVVNECISVACEDSNGTLSILLGDGKGKFNYASSWPTEEAPFIVASGDFNSDGNLDLAVSNICGVDPHCSNYYTAGTVSILLGDGKGNFTKGPSIPGLNHPNQIVVGDFNGDGMLDLAVVVSPGAVAILLGDGTGNFKESSLSPVPVPGPANSIALGDFNDDGHLDLAVAYGFGSAGRVAILLGDGKGHFNLESTPDVGFISFSVVSADFNGDGELDLAVISRCLVEGPYCTNSDGIVTILLGDGTGHFVNAGIADAGSVPYSMAAGDFNGDGYIDLVISGFDGWLLLGDGTGHFTRSNSFAFLTSISSPSVALGDFTGNGRLDVLTTQGQNVEVILQLPDLTISKTHSGSFSSGQTGATYAITVSNSGSAPLIGPHTTVATDTLPAGLTSTGISGTGWDCSSNSFPVTGNGAAAIGCTRNDTLAPGASYPTLSVAVDVAQNAPSLVTNLAQVQLMGQVEFITANNSAADLTAILPVTLILSPPKLVFSPQPVHTTSAAQAVALTNSNLGTIIIKSMAITGDYAETNDCGPSLGPGAGCTISATFTPSQLGSLDGTLTITDNAAGTPHIISLSGTGIDVTPPTITAQAYPAVLWPPDNKLVPVTVTGVLRDSGSGIDPATANFKVTDEYGKFQPAGSIAVKPDGSYSFSVILQASRAGIESGDRVYTISVMSKDRAGNLGAAATTVVVAHDQRQ